MATKSGFTLDVTEDEAVQKMEECFPVDLCAKHNAGLSREIFTACKRSINIRIMSKLSDGLPVSAMDKELMLMKSVVFFKSVRSSEKKLCSS